MGKYGGFQSHGGTPKSSSIINQSILIHFGDLIFIWVNYNDLTATSLEIMVSKGNHPHVALIQVSEI